MAKTVPLRHLTVHPPASGAASTAARSGVKKDDPRSAFADLLRAQRRSVPTRSGAAAGRPETALAEPQFEPPAADTLLDATEAGLPQLLRAGAAQGDPGGDPDGHPAGHPAGDPTNDIEPADDLRLSALPAAPAPTATPEAAALQADVNGGAVVRYLASTVVDFCNDPAVQDGDGWSVRMSLNETVLPSTTLHLSLSRHWLLLRFECDDLGAKRAVSLHREALQVALEQAVSPRREVSIDID